MLTNKEFQEKLKQYDDDYPVAIAINYNGNMGLFYNVTVEGIKVDDLLLVIINNPDIDEEYETLLNGADLDDS